MPLDRTHDAARRSWVDGAQAPDNDFPIQNLPFGRFRRAGGDEPWRIGVAIGDQVLDLKSVAEVDDRAGPLGAWLAPLSRGDLKGFMAFGPAAWQALRLALSDGLAFGNPQQASWSCCLVPMDETELSLPCEIGDYTDFYTGIHHATAVGQLFRPDQPLLPNYKWVPIGYHGRASSIVASGQDFHRPWGQTGAPGADGVPAFGPSQRVDFELELGFLIGTGNALGTPVSIEQAESHLFGVTLLNDWSARDVQAWEYQPLGPFLAKSFATSLSPWVVTMAALAPFRAPFTRPPGDPQPLPYLDGARNRAEGALDITLEARLHTARMREDGHAAVSLTRARSLEAAYWTAAQLVAHHTVNGCNLQPGDLLGSGTLSGPQPGQGGSLLELSAGGKQGLVLPHGESRTFLEDGDCVRMTAYCERDGAVRIGFGQVSATLLPALTRP